ncbi:MAG TPA: hypothetical protein VLS53_03690 [Candidatus Dormibacteraeota bacterium]|nr:hypothetical protein [Candidatus Dormibacteraeota bacterium]
MSVGLGPPQVSPDGKWIWDGQKWLPIPEATWEPAAAALIPRAAVVAAPAQRVVQVSPLEIPPPEPAAFSYPVAVSETPITPLGEEPVRSGRTMYMYIGAAVVVLIMVMVILNSNVIQMPWPGGASSSASQSPRPTISDSARADRLNATLAPALAGAGHTLPALQSACTGTLSSACLTALNAARQQMTDLLSMIDHGDVPPCIAAGTTATRLDLQSMADGIDMSLNGYQDNNGVEVYQGVYRFGYFGRALKADAAAVNAQKTQCSKVTPP